MDSMCAAQIELKLSKGTKGFACIFKSNLILKNPQTSNNILEEMNQNTNASVYFSFMYCGAEISATCHDGR